ncbi:MalY/PatB family protein [Schaalia suimastitidis]|uniref:MalY/PatB family protein n=1 Tax=Schaalia suimastitidis TaxID=121163 RepID=UPI0003FDDFCB|nr:aminotransferase class I/II-fold pyridoxal phosphate-dependent enzyme [Schaalia suimastitidis]
MTVRQFTPDELRDTGLLKWTGITRSDGSPTLGAWVAEMDFGTAPEVEDALITGIQRGFLGYPPPWLDARTREATAAFQARRFAWQLDPETIRLTGAVLPALVRTIVYLTRPDSPVIVPTPAYFPFLTIPPNLGRRVIEVPSLRDEAGTQKRWKLDLEGIEAGLRAGAGLVILCNPWNPTGQVLTEAELRDLHAVVSRYDALVFSDEIHSPLVLDDTPFVSYARLGEEFAAHTVTATAATKGWNFAGLPNAQVILPDDGLRRAWDTAPTHGDQHPIPLGCVATIAAYTLADAWQREVIDIINTNIDLVDRALAGSGIDFVRPQATYLTWWGFDGIDLGGQSPAKVLREEASLGVNAGATLGKGWESWARVNLACRTEVAEQIVERALRVLPCAF